MKTSAGEEVLKEVSEFLEGKLSDELPSPPASIIMNERAQPARDLRQMVALTADCSEIEVPKEAEPEKHTTYRGSEVETVSLTNAPPLPEEETTPLEDIILDYAKRNKGVVEVSRCAEELNVKPEEVSRSLKSLGAKGVIQIQRWQT
jgi:hypothetical protein